VRRRELLRRATLASAAPWLAGRRPARAEARDAANAGAPAAAARSPLPALKRSDVVFMYEAKPPVYAEYGATVLAWGGVPSPQALAASPGVAHYGSVGMVTEFGDYHDRFPKTWEEGLVRDVRGLPVKVPWLTDMQHQGIPYWWCCTRQPQFRTFLEERVAAIVRAGAHGLHVDDHLGTSGALFLGACFCERCVEGFRAHLAALSEADRERLGAAGPSPFDYGSVLRMWLADGPAGETRRVQDHALWPEWTIYQLRGAAAYMFELRALAARVASRPVPVSANAGLLWPNHLADYLAVDYFSAEIDHDAPSRRLDDRPLFAYRLAAAVRRPLASTAAGQDWAFVKEHGTSGLVRGWIAASYAAGQMLMAPRRQWCYTPEKGTHWYEGPTRAYAPLYRFVRDNAALLEGLETHADVALVVPHASYAAARDRWLERAAQLSAANVSYRVALGGDRVVDARLRAEDLGAPVVLGPEPDALLPEDRITLDAARAGGRVVATVEEALARVRPAASVEAGVPVRVLPRVAPGRAVVHLLNRAYEPETDTVRPLRSVALTLDLAALGVRSAALAQVVAPGIATVEAKVSLEGRVVVDVPGEWALVVLPPA